MRWSDGVVARASQWLRERWLETAMVVLLVGVLIWFGDAALGLSPRPVAATVTVTATAARVLPARETPSAAVTATPQASPSAAGTAAAPSPALTAVSTRAFDTAGAYQAVLDQVALGPRPSGSDANRLTGDYIAQSLRLAGWQVEIEAFSYRGTSCRNIIGKAGQGAVQIIGAHYDTRRLADNDPDPSRRNLPVLGANDGASGVAVLLGLAKTLDRSTLTREIWLVFFDAEDNGGLDGWDWTAGSTYMAEHLTVQPEAVIVVDMVGDGDQNIFKERNSTPSLVETIWAIADQLGYQRAFLPTLKWSLLDDHTAFLNRGLVAIDIIDYDYPYWHTTMDTVERISAASLERVGNVLRTYLTGLPPAEP